MPRWRENSATSGLLTSVPLKWNAQVYSLAVKRTLTEASVLLIACSMEKSVDSYLQKKMSFVETNLLYTLTSSDLQISYQDIQVPTFVFSYSLALYASFPNLGNLCLPQRCTVRCCERHRLEPPRIWLRNKRIVAYPSIRRTALRLLLLLLQYRRLLHPHLRHSCALLHP